MDCTFHGLHHWHKDLFEKFGWAILLHEKKEPSKIIYIKHGVEKFIKCVNKSIKNTTDKDRIHDLQILKKDVLILKKKLNIWFKTDSFHHGGNKDCDSDWAEYC